MVHRIGGFSAKDYRPPIRSFDWLLPELSGAVGKAWYASLLLWSFTVLFGSIVASFFQAFQ